MVSASRSRFHGRFRRHHEDADAFADALAELCRVGYPQSPPELRQELIAEQFVRGQSDPELKKYLWVVIRTQKERKLHIIIEVCTDFSRLDGAYTHSPAGGRDLCCTSADGGFFRRRGLRIRGHVCCGWSSPMDRPRSFGTVRFTYIAADVLVLGEYQN